MIEFVQRDVDSEVSQAVSILRDEQGNLAVGDVLRRTCQMVGGEACKQTCQLAERTITGDEITSALRERSCSDLNLWSALSDLKIPMEEVLMVGVTADKVGFADHLNEYEGLMQNPYGWQEIKGFNAFFARQGEEEAIGSRMADCADINFAFKDSEGNTVFGFEHGTRTNMFGSQVYAFEKDGQKVSYTEYVTREAIEHYGADPATIRINLAAAIRGENHHYTFESAEKMEAVLPGWQADSFLTNVSNPDWQSGDPVDPEDQWAADTRGMIVRDIEQTMQTLGIPDDNFDKSNILDPNDSNGMHSSHKTSYKTGSLGTRDLYIIYSK